MIDSKRLDELLEELYAIEPGLRAQDPSLRRLALELLASKPEAPIDERFVQRLRGELLARAATKPTFTFMSLFTSKNRYLLPGFAVLVLAVFGLTALQNRGLNRSSSPSKVASVSGTQRVEANAFGTLTTFSVPGAPSGQEAAGDMALRPSVMTSSPDGNTSAPASPTPMPSLLPTMSGGGTSGIGIATSPDMKMVSPDWIPTVYRYTYAGDAIEGLLTPQVDVYRRVKGAPGAGPLAALQGLNLGLVDLGKAKDGFVQSFTISEKRDNGYIFNVDAQEGLVNIFQNTQWISPFSRCMAQDCYEQNRIKESDLLSADETIRIADAFLVDYGISKAGYGAPVINDQWRVYYTSLAASEKSSYWFPETTSVIYPILIDGKVALDESGMPSGLNVNVDVRSKSVQSVWNLQTRAYQVSSYVAETDAKRLIGVAENTDNYGGGMSENTQYTNIELGTPTVAYVRAWQAASDGSGGEIFVPSLVFPVKNAPVGFWRQSVVVPLAKDLLDVQNVIGIPMPMDAAVKPALPPTVKELR